MHTATSRTGFGHSPPVVEVERRAAEFFGSGDAFYLPTGYVGNHLLVQASCAERTAPAVFLDEAAHYCAEEAARLVGAKICQQLRHVIPCGQGQPLLIDPTPDLNLRESGVHIIDYCT